jgi:hypothetical protein
LEGLGVIISGIIPANFSPKDFSTQSDILNKILVDAKYTTEKRLRSRKFDEKINH